MIPLVWREYSCTMKGAILKFVECENCGTAYVYQMRREVVGAGVSLYFLNNRGAERRAQSQAKEALQARLDEDCDAVPCLHCGHYQNPMVRKLRRRFTTWLPWVVLTVILFSVVFTALAWSMHNDPDPRARTNSVVPLVVTVVSALASIAGAVGLVMAYRYDPNRAPVEQRRNLGRELALTTSEYEQLVKQQEK